MENLNNADSGCKIDKILNSNTMYEPHSSFISPPDNALLWRYMDFTKFVSLLESESLYFTRSDKFDDPFEGSYPIINVELRKTIEGMDVEKTSKMFKAMRKYMAINCWHESPHESAAMWKLYLKSNEGIAIVTTFSRLSTAIIDKKNIYIGRVSYIDYENDGINASNMFNPFLHKRKSFEHEREVRAIYNEFLVEPGNDQKEPTLNLNEDVLGHGINVSVDLKKLIHGVVVSPDSPEWLFKLVQATVKRFGFSFDVSQSTMNNSPVY